MMLNKRIFGLLVFLGVFVLAAGFVSATHDRYDSYYDNNRNSYSSSYSSSSYDRYYDNDYRYDNYREDRRYSFLDDRYYTRNENTRYYYRSDRVSRNRYRNDDRYYYSSSRYDNYGSGFHGRNYDYQQFHPTYHRLRYGDSNTRYALLFGVDLDLEAQRRSSSFGNYRECDRYRGCYNY